MSEVKVKRAFSLKPCLTTYENTGRCFSSLVKMPKTRELTDFEKGQIYALFQEKMPYRKIARQLQIAESTVRYI